MNMLEALHRVRENPALWARPESWVGLHSAFTLDGIFVYRVPSLTGGEVASMPDLLAMSEPWELVDPDRVNAGL